MNIYFPTREEYVSTRDGYARVAQESSKLFDHSLLTLCVGAIGGSVYFATEREIVLYTFLVFIGWFLLGLCVAVTILSFKVSEEVNRDSLAQINAMYNGGNKPLENEIEALIKKIKKKKGHLKIMERWGIGLLLGGILFVGLFICLNIGHPMDNKAFTIHSEGITSQPINVTPVGPTQPTIQPQAITKGVTAQPINMIPTGAVEGSSTQSSGQ